MVAAHARFLALSLWEARSDFADVQLNCKDGVFHLNRLLVGFILPSLCSLEEFNSCLTEVVVVLPHSSVGQIMKAVDKFLCGVQGFKEEAECVVEGEILMVEGRMVEKELEERFTAHKAGEPLPETVVDTESVNGERVLGSEVEGCDDEGAPSDPNCDLMREVKCEISESSDDKKDSKHQSSLPPIHIVTSQANLTNLPNSSGHVVARMQQSSQKPHQCTTCGKGFVSRSNMRAHMRLHEGTALRYQCPHCEKKFSHPSEVKQHQVVHTGIRAYCCSRCGNRYSRYPSLWKHKRKCHLIPKPELLLVSPANGALLVKQEKAVLVEGSMDGTLVVDEIVIGTDGIKNTNRSAAFPVHSFSIQSSA